MAERQGSLITHDAPRLRKYFKRRYPPGTIREPQPPDPELVARVKAGQKQLDGWIEDNRRGEILTAADYAATVNARDY